MGAIILIICEGGGCGENDNDFVFAQLTREEVIFILGAMILIICEVEHGYQGENIMILSLLTREEVTFKLVA